jgi:aldehyde:ferredoxin oxidoreductase
MNGHAGKILRLNLSTREITTIDTRRYEQWVGGHGMGTAIFWDLMQDKAIDGFDPRNVITIMTSPLSGTLAPGASARTEVQGIGVQSYPIGWYTRSNFGGRFGPMLKFAGWDGIVIEGQADRPVWFDVRNGDVEIRDASSLWGLDTWQTQEAIWGEVMGSGKSDGWTPLGQVNDGSRTTQRPAVLTIGPA